MLTYRREFRGSFQPLAHVTKSVVGPGRAKTPAAFSVWRVLSLDDLSRRVLRFVDFYGWCGLIAGRRRSEWRLADTGQFKAKRCLCAHRCDQRADAQDVHDPFEIIGQHMQCHFGADPFERLHLEVG